jgi:methylglutaconyl-coA hydratase, mitochondrial
MRTTVWLAISFAVLFGLAGGLLVALAATAERDKAPVMLGPGISASANPNASPQIPSEVATVSDASPIPVSEEPSTTATPTTVSPTTAPTASARVTSRADDDDDDDRDDDRSRGRDRDDDRDDDDHDDDDDGDDD